jgi:hypothetical protein
MPSTSTIALIVFSVLALVFLWQSALALKRGRPFRSFFRLLMALLWLALAAVVGLAALALQGYRALTLEEVAATVRTEPMGDKAFRAHVMFADGRQGTYIVSGDELYVDAHIVKWKPWANIVGLHTAYELDRLGGRYADIKEEQTAARTVHPLTPDKPLNLFTLRRRYAFLSPVVDADYGSGTFVPAREKATFEVRVSTSGLLIRQKTDAN